MDGIYSRYNLVLGGLPPMFQGVEAVVMENIVKLENIIADSLKNFVSGILNVASKVVSIVLTPILTLYFLVDKDYFKEKITRLIPERHRRDTLYLASTINTSLNQFIRGRLLMSLYIAIATTILLLIMGIDFAVGIGFITGLFDIVPYIGPLLGYLPAVFFASISKPIKAVWVSVFFVLIQWVENNVLAPKIIGENMGMHPMLILLSIIIGGGIFGVFGMILSVPIVAITRIVYIFFMEKKRR
jgi:predicted PurR-regulated permease PerM